MKIQKKIKGGSGRVVGFGGGGGQGRCEQRSEVFVGGFGLWGSGWM